MASLSAKRANFILKARPECAICLNEFFNLDLAISACEGNHMYHEDCILDWLDKSNTCPLCKKQTVSKDMREVFNEDKKRFDVLTKHFLRKKNTKQLLSLVDNIDQHDPILPLVLTGFSKEQLDMLFLKTVKQSLSLGNIFFRSKLELLQEYRTGSEY